MDQVDRQEPWALQPLGCPKSRQEQASARGAGVRRSPGLGAGSWGWGEAMRGQAQLSDELIGGQRRKMCNPHPAPTPHMHTVWYYRRYLWYRFVKSSTSKQDGQNSTNLGRIVWWGDRQ